MQFDWSAIWPAIPLLLEGAKMTLWISVLGLVGGLIIGLVAGFARTYGGVSPAACRSCPRIGLFPSWKWCG